MNKDFMRLLMEKTGFPAEARTAYEEAASVLERTGQAVAMDGAVEFYYDNDFSTELVTPLIEEMAKDSGVPVYTVWGLFLAFAAENARRDYLKNGIDEEVFWATFCDLRYKALECKANHNIWGNFVPFWYPIFYRCDIVKLGRLEYETSTYNGPAAAIAGHPVEPGQKVLSIHIPSSGEPFDRAARLESYRLAYDFFQGLRGSGPLICKCHSWLLYPEYKNVLPATSNIVDFMGDFTILEEDAGSFEDAWRVFGPDAGKPAEELPEKTSMQRAFKKHLMAGGKTGCALGVLVFDGEKLLAE